MALRTALINGNSITQDYDFGYLLQSMVQGGGYVEGLEVQAGLITAGKGFIACERTNGNKPFVFVELTENYVVDTTGTKKVWIEVPLTVLDDGSENNEDGTDIAIINTGASYPADNYIPLASITGGTITDERVILKMKKSSADLDGITSPIDTTEEIHSEKDINADGDVTAEGEMTAEEFNTPSGGLQEQINNVINSLGIVNPDAGEVITSGKGTYMGSDGLQYEYRGDYYAKTAVTATHSLVQLVGVDATRFLMITTVGGYGVSQQHYAIAGEISGTTITLGSPLLVFTGQSVGVLEPQKLTTDTFVFAYSYYDGGSTHVASSILTLAGTVVSKGTQAVAYTTGGGGPSIGACCKVSATSFMIYANASGTGIYVATISGTTITFGSKVGATYTLLAYASDGVVCAFAATQAYKITVSGTVPTVGNNAATGLTATSAIARNYASNKILYGARSTDLKIMFIDVSGATPTMGTITTVHTGEEITSLNMFSSNVVMIGPATTARIYFYYTDGTTFYAQSYVVMPGIGITGNLVQNKGIFHYGGYVYGITNGGLKILGIAQATGIIGDGLIISTTGKKSSVHSGLIAGLNAYLSRTTGAIDYISTGIFIGQVLSDTELVVGINY